jgi:hypothetical protein
MSYRILLSRKRATFGAPTAHHTVLGKHQIEFEISEAKPEIVLRRKSNARAAERQGSGRIQILRKLIGLLGSEWPCSLMGAPSKAL